MAKKQDGYNLEPSFERKVALMLAKRPKFYNVIGRAIEPDALSQASVMLVAKAVRSIAKETGSSPSDEVIVLQRIRSWVEDGNVTQEQLDDVIDLFIEAPRQLPAEDEMVAALQPVLRRRMEAETVRVAMEEYARKGDFQRVVSMVNEAQSLGRVDKAVGLRLGAGAFKEIEHLKAMHRLSTGITELDVGLDGGLPRGCEGVFVAPPGGGKSMFLNHVAAHSAKAGMFVLVASLEINRAMWMARIMANLTGEPITKIMAADFVATQRKIEKMYPILGTVIVKDFPAKLTTMKDICAWADACAEEEGYPPHLLVVDYADKCNSHIKSEDKSYDAQGTIYETMRLYAFEHNMWAWTASQPRRAAGKEKRRRIELDDLAESNKKAHVADLIVTGNKDASGEMIEYVVPKFRYGKSDWAVGPLPHDWAVGRMVAEAA